MRKADLRGSRSDSSEHVRTGATAPLRRAVRAAFGVVCPGFGALGVALPILPTVPLLMAAA